MAVIDFKTSWLKDEDGAFYCPRTIIEAIQSASGKSFDNYVKEDIIAKSKITLLEDVNISNEKDKQFIVYNSTTKQWENKDMISVVTSYIDGINIAQITILGEEYNIIVPITNKSTLDELSTSEDGNLLFKGKEIKGGGDAIITYITYGEVFSEEEKVIGSWTNGKPIYQKTFLNLSLITRNSSWAASGCTIENIETLVNCLGYTEYYLQSYPMIACVDTDSYDTFKVMNPRNDDIEFVALTVQYTKSTDAEGSFTPGMVKETEFIPDDSMNAAIEEDKF